MELLTPALPLAVKLQSGPCLRVRVRAYLVETMLEAAISAPQSLTARRKIDRNGRVSGGKSFCAPRREGHRENLRRRLLNGDGETFCDREILEALLITAIPHLDVKPLVAMLFRQFGSLHGVLNASSRSVIAIPGLKGPAAAILKLPRVVATLLAQTYISENPIISNLKTLVDYATIHPSGINSDRLRVLYLNTQNRLLLDHTLTEGCIDEVTISIREVIGNAMTLGAAALFLVRNSTTDMAETTPTEISIVRKVAEAGYHLGIVIHDHVVIARKECVSLKSTGLI